MSRKLIDSVVTKSPSNIFIFLLALCTVIFLFRGLLLKKTVYGDGIYYYSYVRSWIIDRDNNFSNEYRYFNVEQPTTKTNLKANVYAIGPALLWAPSFQLLHAILNSNGYTLVYQLAVGLTSVFSFFVGLLLLYRLLCKFFLERIAVITALLMALGTNLFFYGVLDPVNSHAISFLVSTVVLTLVLERRNSFITGVCIGGLALMRSQDMIFLLLLLPSLKRFFSGALGSLISFSVQLIFWYILFGTFLTSPYLDEYHFFDFMHPQILSVLLSPNNGVLLWTPLFGISLAGIFLRSFPKEIPKNQFIFLFLVQLWLIASWSFWWQGASFSGRMFISLLPLLAFGLATVVKKIPQHYHYLLVFIVTLLNAVSILLYLLTH